MEPKIHNYLIYSSSHIHPKCHLFMFLILLLLFSFERIHYFYLKKYFCKNSLISRKKTFVLYLQNLKEKKPQKNKKNMKNAFACESFRSYNINLRFCCDFLKRLTLRASVSGNLGLTTRRLQGQQQKSSNKVYYKMVF